MKLIDLVEIKEKEINLEDIAIAKRQNNKKRKAPKIRDSL